MIIAIEYIVRLPLIIYPSSKYIVVRNINDPGASFIYRGHSAVTTVAKFSPNGYWVASADVTGKIKVWSWDNPEHLTKMESGVFASKISDLDWDFESKRIVVAGDGSGLVVKCITWDTANSLGEMVGHNKKVNSVCYKPTRPFRIMSASEDMRTCFYAGPPFQLDHSNSSVHCNFVNCVRFSPDGNKCVSVSSDKKIQMYDGKTGEPNGEVVNAHAGGIYSVAFSPDSAYFITASADKTIKLWNSSDLTCEQTFITSSDPQIGDAQVSVLWNKAFILSVSLNGNINIWNRSNPSVPERIIQAHQVSITAMKLDRSSLKLYTGSFDGVICVTDLSENSTSLESKRLIGTDKRNISGGSHIGKVVGISIVDDLITSVGWDDKIRFGSQSSLTYNLESELLGQPCCIVPSSSSTSDLFLVVTNTEIAIYRGTTKVSSTTISTLGFVPTCAALWNEEEVAIGGSDSKTHIYALNDSNSFILLKTIETRSSVSALAYHPSGEALAIGDEGRQVEVYERSSWDAKVKGKWVFHSSKITCLSWSLDGQYLASGSLDENIYIWNYMNYNDKIQIPFTHMGGVTGIEWLATNKLVSVGNDHTIVTWNIPKTAT